MLLVMLGILLCGAKTDGGRGAQVREARGLADRRGLSDPWGDPRGDPEGQVADDPSVEVNKPKAKKKKTPQEVEAGEHP